MRLFLIRHAESVWNQKGLVQGRGNSRLSQQGREQAKRLAERLSTEGIEFLYSSPLARAHQTAKRISEVIKLPINKLSELSEISLGAWEGKTIPQIQVKYPRIYQKWLRSPSGVTIPGAEPIKVFRKRVVRAFDKIHNRHDGRAVAIITHGGVIALWLSHILNADFDSIFTTLKLDNTGITHLEWVNGRTYVISMNG